MAEDYDRHRPGPPSAAVRWLVPAGAVRAVDLGAGTGALSTVLADLVTEVVALDIDPRMLEVAGRRAPGAHRTAARAEALPLADASADLIAAASSWHWVDPARALPEAARVLRPGGTLGLLWSGPDRSVGWVGDVFGAGRGDERCTGDRSWRWRDAPVAPPGVPFGPVEQSSFTASLPYRTDAIGGLVASYSGVITLPADQRRAIGEAVAGRVARHPDLAGRKIVELPLRCRAMRLRRLG